MKSLDPKNRYTFNYDWSTVVKSFLNKYPCKELSFVKWNKIVGLIINPDNSVTIQRIAISQKFKFLWGLGLEIVDIDFQNQVLDMQTRMICKSQLFPNFCGLEQVKYKAVSNNQTIYEKLLLEESSFVMKYATLFNSSFHKGIQVIEDKCREFVLKKSLLK